MTDTERIRAVIDLHGPVQDDPDETPMCGVCFEPYPCETVQILTR